jgi:hypothetical protein
MPNNRHMPTVSNYTISEVCRCLSDAKRRMQACCLPYPILDTRAGVSTPSLRASSCASMTTLMAFSVNRSNIACVVCLLPRPAARVLRCTAACRVAGRTGLLTASTAFARLNPLKGCSLTAARCLPAMHFGVSGAVRWTDARIVGTPMHWVPRVSCMVLLSRCQSLFGLRKDLGESLYNTNVAVSRRNHTADSNAIRRGASAFVGFGDITTTGCPGA